MPEDNEKKLAQAEKKIEELMAELEKQKGIAENAEATFNKWSNERGDERKAVKEIAEELKNSAIAMRTAITDKEKIAADLAEARIALAEAKKQGPNTDDGNKPNEPPPTKKTADEIEAELTDDEQEKLDEAWKNASEDLRKSIKGDDKIRRQFLQQAKEAAEEEASSDLSSWRKKPAQQKKADPGGAAEEIKKLFDKNINRARNLPDGSGGNTTRTQKSGGNKSPSGRTTNILG